MSDWCISSLKRSRTERARQNPPFGRIHSGLILLWNLVDLRQVRQLDETPNPLAKEELNLLARLMGSVKAENVPRTEMGFRINLFPTEPEEEAA